MIKSKEEYKYYLKCDKEALDIKYKKPRIFGDEIWKFERLMRKYEWYQNCKSGILSKIIKEILHFKYKRKSLLYGFSIPINTFGPGLNIIHLGTILINGNAKVGNNCRINAGVVIRHTNAEKRMKHQL